MRGSEADVSVLGSRTANRQPQQGADHRDDRTGSTGTLKCHAPGTSRQQLGGATRCYTSEHAWETVAMAALGP